MRLLGLFALVFLVGVLFQKLGLITQTAVMPTSLSFVAAMVMGLVAGTSSCLAVTGGLLLSTASKFEGRMRPVILFVVGRVIGYGLFGSFIGWIGSSFFFSPLITGGLIIFAALYMFLMGLEMLHITPKWLKKLIPTMPKSLSRRIVKADGSTHPLAPFSLGAATFFLPCGFTQMLQVYALTTGSAMESGLLLLGFAIGTIPALLALGWASRALKGKAGKFFFQFSGAVVIVLGLWNIQNGLALAGIVTPEIPLKQSASGYEIVQSIIDDPNVKTVDGVQTIAMSLLTTDPYYSPSDVFTVKAGIPVRINLSGKGTGCRSVFQIPKLGVSTALSEQENTLTFTPKKSGRYLFSCGMGMYRGTLNVI